MAPYIDEIKAFVKENVLGKERTLDVLSELPSPAYDAFKERKLPGWWLPESIGGRGMTLEASLDVVSELAYGDAGLAFAFFIPILSSTSVLLFGTPDQRERFLRPMTASGSWGGATMASEKLAGSELLKTATTAEKNADGGYTLHGEKYFSTNAGIADYYVVYARVHKESPSFRAFVVPRGTPGLKLVRRWPMFGVRASGTYEISVEGCQVPPENVLAGNGIRILEASLNGSRTLMAGTAVGIARRARDLCLEYASKKVLGEKSLMENEVFMAKMGQMEADIETMTQVCKAAAREQDEMLRQPNAAEIAGRKGALKSVVVAKLVCGQIGWRVVTAASEMFGGFGYTDDSLVGKLLRDMRYAGIVEAGEDVLRSLMFGRYVLPAYADPEEK